MKYLRPVCGRARNTSMAVRKVLMTGASGYVASQLLPTFRQRYDTLLIDASTLYSRGRSSWPDLEQNRQGEHVEGVATADLNDPDRSSYARYFEGVDAVVHLAFKRDSGEPLDHFFDAKFNVEMNYNVFRCAYDAGVRRVVMASSNAAASWNDRPPMRGRRTEMQDPYKLPLSDNFYGWAKATTEHMGFLFACGGLGRRMEVVMVRVGVPRAPDPLVYAADPAQYKFSLAGYVSPSDLDAVVRQGRGDAQHRERARPPVAGGLRHQQQQARPLVVDQRPPGSRLPTGRRLRGQVRRRYSEARA